MAVRLLGFVALWGLWCMIGCNGFSVTGRTSSVGMATTIMMKKSSAPSFVTPLASALFMSKDDDDDKATEVVVPDEEGKTEEKAAGLALVPLFFKLCVVLFVKFLTDLTRPFKYLARKTKAQWSRVFSKDEETANET